MLAPRTCLDNYRRTVFMSTSMQGKPSSNRMDPFDVIEPKRLLQKNSSTSSAKECAWSAPAHGQGCKSCQPSALHHLLSYCSKGIKQLSPLQAKALKHVHCHAIVPVDFESSYAYGPLSHFSYEERVIMAFENELLELRTSLCYDDVKFCTFCGEVGHWRCDCPRVFDVELSDMSIIRTQAE